MTGKDVANIDIIVDSVSDLTKDMKLLVNNLNRSQEDVAGKISSILDENRGSIRDAIRNFDSITRKLDQGDGSLALLLNDRALYRNITDASASIRVIAGRIEKGEGTIGKLVNDDTLYVDARSAVSSISDGMKDVKEIAGKINRGQGTMGKLVNDEALYAEVRDAAHNIKDITRKINDGEGTIGKLVNEDKMYRDTTATLKKAEKAMEGLSDSGPISVLGSIIGTLF